MITFEGIKYTIRPENWGGDFFGPILDQAGEDDE